MKHLIKINLLSFCTLLVVSCSNEEAPYNPTTDPDAVELGIDAGVSLTKSAINAGTDDTNFKSIAVYAVGASTSYGTGNNYALYTKNSSWESGTNKIYLTSEVATIYAYHPAYTPDPTDKYMKDSGTTLTVTGTPSANSTIGISVFEGKNTSDTYNKYPTDINNADKIYSSAWTENTTDKAKIISAPGEVDYMWAEDANKAGNAATASNGKKESGTPVTNANEVSLKMKHALAMVSFRIYNDGHYTNAGSLTKIILSNKAGEGLSKGTNPTMKISDGTIVENTAVSATYSRFIDGGYNIVKVGTTPSATVATTEQGAKDGSKKFSILVLPTSTADAANIEATFTIDGAEYTVALGGSGDKVDWKKGTNNIYTVKLSGQELSLASVTVEGWSAGNNKDLGVK